MNIRGLHNFLTEVSLATSKQQVNERINIELFKIKKSFGSSKISSYDRKKYIAKLCFIILTGKRIDFGFQQVIDLLGSKKTSFQRIGWMATSVFCGNDEDKIKFFIPEIKKQLYNKKDENGICLALSAISSICNEELADSISSIVTEIAFDINFSEYTRKKALLTLTKIYQISLQLSLINHVFIKAPVLLMDNSYGLRLCTANLIKTILEIQPNFISGIYSVVLDVLYSFFVSNEYDKDFDESLNLPCPILTAKLIQILKFKNDWNTYDIMFLEEIILNLIQKYPSNDNEKEIIQFYSIFYRVIDLIWNVDVSDFIFHQIIEILSQDVNSNYHYLQVYAIKKLIFLIQIVPRFSSIIDPYLDKYFKTMRESNELNQIIIELLYTVSNKENGLKILSQFLDYLPKAPSNLFESLCLKSAQLIRCYGHDNIWSINQLVLISKYYDNYKIFEIAIEIISISKATQDYIIKVFMNIQLDQISYEFIIKIFFYVVGEYCSRLENNIIDRLMNLLNNIKKCSEHCLGIIINSLFKIGVQKNYVCNKVIDFMKKNLNSYHFDISQRCKEYLIILNYPYELQMKIIKSNSLYQISDDVFNQKNEKENTKKVKNINYCILYQSDQIEIDMLTYINFQNTQLFFQIVAYNDMKLNEFTIKCDENLLFTGTNNKIIFLQKDSLNTFNVNLKILDFYKIQPKLKIIFDHEEIIKVPIPVNISHLIKQIKIEKDSFLKKWNEIQKEKDIHLVIPDGDLITESSKILNKSFGFKPLIEGNIIAVYGCFEFANEKYRPTFLFKIYCENNEDFHLSVRSNSKNVVNNISNEISKMFKN